MSTICYWRQTQKGKWTFNYFLSTPAPEHGLCSDSTLARTAGCIDTVLITLWTRPRYAVPVQFSTERLALTLRKWEFPSWLWFSGLLQSGRTSVGLLPENMPRSSPYTSCPNSPSTSCYSSTLYNLWNWGSQGTEQRINRSLILAGDWLPRWRVFVGVLQSLKKNAGTLTHSKVGLLPPTSTVHIPSLNTVQSTQLECYKITQEPRNTNNCKLRP
jgi:hypothetical protein